MDFVGKDKDRRRKFRFVIDRDIRYKIIDNGAVVASGAGKTLNICSGGVEFIAEQPLAPEALVELSISWPVLLDASCPMRLIVLGRVLRCSDRNTVCTVDKYEFRTQSRIYQPPNPTRTDRMLQRWADSIRKDGIKASMAGA